MTSSVCMACGFGYWKPNHGLLACGDSAVEVAILSNPVKKRPGEEDHHPIAHNFKFMPYLIMVEVEAVLQLSE